MIKVLIADPNPTFAGMIREVLEESGRFTVVIVASGAEAMGAASREQFDIVLLESSLEDFSLRDAVTVLRRNQPYLPIMIILPFGEHPLPDAAKFFDVQGILAKPLYVPDLQKRIEAALAKPVNGFTPPPRNPEPLPPAAAPEIASSTPLRPRASTANRPPAPAWLDDVSRAAQYLTTLTLESSASAALLMRDQHLIAFAGQCTQADADELARLVANHWAKDGGGGQGAQVRFIHLPGGGDYLVYSTLAAQDVVLSMAFQAETPLGQIRKQAKRATEALLKTPAEMAAPLPAADQVFETRAASSTLAPASSISDPIPSGIERAASQSQPIPDEHAVILESLLLFNHPPETTAPTAFVGSPATPDLDPAKLDTDKLKPERLLQPAADAQATRLPADLEPIPDSASLNQLTNRILELERSSLEQPPLIELPAAPLPNLRRTPHALYDLSYTILILPRILNALSGDLQTRLEQWLIALSDAYDWEATAIRVNPDHVEISLHCAPSDSPEQIVKTILTETSDRILAEFPRLAAEHPKRPGTFWSSGYYIVTPGRRLASEEITAFLEYQRREHSGGKF